MKPLTNYVLSIADNALILGHRLSEWCGHGPILEQDIAMTNIALDLIGQSRAYYQYAASIEGDGYDEDYFPFKRLERQFTNCLLVELPNGDFGKTIARHFLFDVFHFYFLEELSKSKDDMLRALAIKSLKEVTYHLRYSSEWMQRLGDGTDQSHARIQESLNAVWDYRNELITPSDLDLEMAGQGIGVDLNIIAPKFDAKINEIIEKATLTKPTTTWNQLGGKKGVHTEHLGFLLTELQYMQRAFPDSKW
jgi:ring-1,2-phenylacetyl-CoA epoxidase subunit PaaC